MNCIEVWPVGGADPQDDLGQVESFFLADERAADVRWVEQLAVALPADVEGNRQVARARPVLGPGAEVLAGS